MRNSSRIDPLEVRRVGIDPVRCTGKHRQKGTGDIGRNTQAEIDRLWRANRQILKVDTNAAGRNVRDSG